jgi:beta-glucosidase
MDNNAKYLDPNLDVEQRVNDLIKRLNIDEKITLIRGKGFWTTNPIERLEIPPFGMTDGPLGIAWHSSHWGKHTRFPATIGLAATWNKELAYKMGQVLGKETKLAGRHQILAPGVNIIRSPLCGRNFEYLSEDPILSSEIASEIVKGIQSQNIAVCIKHYITNNSETKRMKISTEISERALQEIYVKNYKRIIEKSDPWGLMACYNKINGIYGPENKYILTDILRDQLGFTGHVTTDWGAAKNTSGAAACIKAGLSLEMPGMLLSRVMTPRKVKKALKRGEIVEKDIDCILKPLLRTFMRVGLFEQEEESYSKITDNAEHQDIAQQIAEESMVLLKNDSNILPINLKEIKKIAIIGPNAKKKFGKPFQGGSSAVIPPQFITPYDGIKSYVSESAEIIDEPEDADITLLIIGLDHGGSLFKNLLFKTEGDTEGSDRTHYGLPKKQIKLIDETLAKNSNTIIILIAGSPIDCSEWYDKVPAILNAWYPGMMGGNALARVLFGEVNPSGKLPVTYPKKLQDHPAHKSKKRFPGDLKELKIYFDEGILVGYRYFDQHHIEPFFPFGFGLSYTEFELSNIQVDKSSIQEKGSFTLSVDITNKGNIAGAETVQIYIGDDKCSVERPPRELQAFEKVYLNSGEVKTVSITLDESAFEFYSVKEKKFIAESGSFTIWAGTSSRNLPLSTKIICSK